MLREFFLGKRGSSFAGSEQELSPEKLREKLKDPTYLPKHSEISRAFGSGVDRAKDFQKFCFDQQNPVFEFINTEFIDAFGDYLSERLEVIRATKDSPINILEAGAGNGRLTHFLRQRIESKLPGKARLIASDSGKWNLRPTFPVEVLDYDAAVKKYAPEIVVCSWMPYREDFSAAFRASKCVREYILIGETEGGCCGGMWKTWGKKDYSDDEEEIKATPPYIEDGFEREDLENISKFQICRRDEPGNYFHSGTVSFRRKK